MKVDVMRIDQIEEFGRSSIQHGPANDRVYLMKLDKGDFPQIIAYINGLAVLHGYSKVFVKVPGYAENRFRQDRYRIEATIPGFYNGNEDGLFMGRYFLPDRLVDHDADLVHQVLETAKKKAGSSPKPVNDARLQCRLAAPADCVQMAELYREVFASYPFPIDSPEYLAGTMAENIIYAGVWEDGRLLALASAEIDRDGANAEMTDFATHPDYRGRGLANLLLSKLEALMAEFGIKTCYTIARATSYGMNIVFAQHAYRFGGTLVKNTQISGGLESMNVWYKQLPGGRS